MKPNVKILEVAVAVLKERNLVSHGTEVEKAIRYIEFLENQLQPPAEPHFTFTEKDNEESDSNEQPASGPNELDSDDSGSDEESSE